MKRFSILAMSVVVAIVLAGCGGEKAAESPSDADKDKSPEKKAADNLQPKNDGTNSKFIANHPGTTTDGGATSEPIEQICTVEGLGEGLSKTVPKSKFIGSLGKALFQGAAEAAQGDNESESTNANDGDEKGSE